MTTPTPQTFAGRTVLVTGGSSGLGAASVRRFAAAGAHVHAASRDQAALAEVAANCADLPGSVSFGPLEVSDPDSCRAAVADAVAAGGGLDVLVNNAGRHDFRHAEQVTDDLWHHDLAVNLSGAFFCAQAAIPHLLRAEGGVGNIVNVASVAGLTGEVYSAAYSAAKHGVVGLTKALAVEYLKQPLRVNCVCPGGMDTEQVRGITIPEEADFDLIMKISATRGFMSADSVAAVVAFLASPEAGSVNGAVQVVDHGHLAG